MGRRGLTWNELEQATPEIAAHGRRLLERDEFAFVATLAKDGSPRVNTAEAYIVDGHLLTNIDLLGDSRVYLHSAVVTREGTEAEFTLAGCAIELEDGPLREKLYDTFWQLINWRPDPDSHYFEIFAERAAYHRYGDDERGLRWSA